MARDTRRDRDVVVAVHVAVSALARRNCVQAGQGESGGIVVKRGIQPGSRVVALLAGLRKIGRDVVGIGRPLKILQMAGNARRAGQVVIVVDVTIGAQAGRNHVASGQRESGGGVVELCVEPTVGAVARLAGGGKLSGDVIGVGRALEFGRMAGIAIRGHGLELAVSRALVAGITLDGGMGPGQGKAVVVPLHLLNIDVPTFHGVALLAVGTELALVDVGVAILAALAHIGENHLHVTLGAGHRFVHTAQGIPGMVVIEFGHGADGTPPRRRVAVLAGDVQIAVRTAGGGGGVQARASRRYKSS